MKAKLVFALAVLFLASAARADGTWVYAYTGNELNGCECQIDGSFTTATQISPLNSSSPVPISVLSYSFSVAGFTFDQSDSTGGIFAETDASGNIVEWTVSLDAGNYVNLITSSSGSTENFDSEIDVYGYGSGPNDTDSRFDDPGSWTANDPNPVPEPSSLLLSGIGLVALIALMRRGSASGLKPIG